MPENLSKLTQFASAYRDLFRDKRLFDGFAGTLQGILGSQSLCVSKIANAGSLLPGRHAERRIRRLAHGENPRAALNAQTITKRLTEEGRRKSLGKKKCSLCSTSRT